MNTRMKTEDYLNAFYALLFAFIVGAIIIAACMREYRDARIEADAAHADRVFIEGGVK